MNFAESQNYSGDRYIEQIYTVLFDAPAMKWRRHIVLPLFFRHYVVVLRTSFVFLADVYQIFILNSYRLVLNFVQDHGIKHQAEVDIICKCKCSDLKVIYLTTGWHLCQSTQMHRKCKRSFIILLWIIKGKSLLFRLLSCNICSYIDKSLFIGIKWYMYMYDMQNVSVYLTY